MFIDQITLAEGSVIQNLTVETGTVFPLNANSGELFFRTDIENGSLFIYAGGQWLKSSNITNVTPESIGLGNVSNTSDNDKPISTAQQTALNLKVDAASLAPVATSGSYNDLIDKPTSINFGLDQVNNTSDVNKPVSIAQQAALNLKVDAASLAPVATSGSYNDLSNKPILPTLASLGLSNVNNTSDANKPVSIAQQAALNLKVDAASLAPVATSGSYNDLIDKPINSSYILPVATATELGGVKQGAGVTISVDGIISVSGGSGGPTEYILPVASSSILGGILVGSGLSMALDGVLSTDLAPVATSGNYNDLSNKPIITPLSLGLGNVNNTADVDKPISSATQTALNLKADISSLGTVAFSNNYNDLSNKPIITPLSLGLGNVNNTADVDKPISSATQTALNLKADISSLAPVATSGNYNDLNNLPGNYSYTLPEATNSVLGGIKVGTGLSVSIDGTLSIDNNYSYVLPIATTTILGGVKQGFGINITPDGTIQSDLNLSQVAYDGFGSLAFLSDVKFEQIFNNITSDLINPLTVGDVLIYTSLLDPNYDRARFFLDPQDPEYLNINDPQYYINSWVNSQLPASALPIATTSELGVIKVGNGLSIDIDGTLETTGEYTLPVATATELGGVKQGSGVTISGDGTISATGTSTPEALSPFLLCGC